MNTYGKGKLMERKSVTRMYKLHKQRSDWEEVVVLVAIVWQMVSKSMARYPPTQTLPDYAGLFQVSERCTYVYVVANIKLPVVTW